MKNEINPPEFSNPLEANLDGMFSSVRANMSKRDIVNLTLVVAMGLSGCEVLPSSTGTPDLTSPSSTKVAPTEITIGPATPETFTPTETPAPSEMPTSTETSTLVETPTLTQIPLEHGPSLEFSPLFPAEWHKEWNGTVTLENGSTLDIPIIIGLSDDVVHDNIQPNNSITGVWMTQEGTNDVADMFLRAAYYRYTKVMGNNVTYEQYLELLEKPSGGEVDLMILDNNGVTRREAMIDPRQGFSMLISDKLDPRYSMSYSLGNNMFFGVDGHGRLLFTANTFFAYERSGDSFIDGVNVKDYAFVYENFAILSSFGYIENRCLEHGSILQTCGALQGSSERDDDWWQLLIAQTNEMIAKNAFQPPFGLEKP